MFCKYYIFLIILNRCVRILNMFTRSLQIIRTVAMVQMNSCDGTDEFSRGCFLKEARGKGSGAVLVSRIFPTSSEWAAPCRREFRTGGLLCSMRRLIWGEWKAFVYIV